MTLLLDILQIVIPALLIVGGGALGYWKFLHQQEAKDKLRIAELKAQGASHRLKADDAAWKRMMQVMDDQSIRIDTQDTRISKLEMEIGEANVCIGKLQRISKDCQDSLEECEEDNHKLKTLLKEK